MNGDGKPDLVLTVSDDDANLDAIVLLGNGDGTFQPAIYFVLYQLENAQGIPFYQTPSVVIEDLNLDGKQDLVFSNGQVGLGNGDGTFVLLFFLPPCSHCKAISRRTFHFLSCK